MTTRDQVIERVLNKLRNALGTKEDPPGSNHNFITEWYNANVYRIGNGAWCEMTQTWAMWTSGAKELKRGRAYTVYAVRDAMRGVNGSSWHWGTAGVRPGDVFYFDWDLRRKSAEDVDHTGMVERVNDNGTFYVLEGNIGNALKRVLRSDKYVVGYVRYDWDRLVKDDPKPEPVPVVVKPQNPGSKTHKPDRHKTAKIQQLLEVYTDGKWGSNTDARARRMRAAAMRYSGYPKPVIKKFNTWDVQNVIGTAQDGKWGPKSQAALRHWVRQMQAVLKVPVDGQWGPQTDNAFLTVRSQNLNKF